MKLINIHNSRREIVLFCRDDKGNLIIDKKDDFFPYFYELDREGKFKTVDGKLAKKVFTSQPSDVPKSRSDNSYEADILFVKRYMIDRIKQLDKCPIKYAFIDIEVLADELPNVQQALLPISCISVYNSFNNTIQTWYLGHLQNESELLRRFIDYMKEEKFDLWLSWNVKFDYNYLYNRIEATKNDKKSLAELISPINKSRYGDGEVFYPAGISIVDYLLWDKKVTLNRRKSYALDNVAQEELKDKPNEKIEFGKLNPKIKEKNIHDIERMVKLEAKLKYIDYFDEIRRLTKVEWEDMVWNCLDEKSEILTKKGWKNYKTILQSDKVLSYNLFSKEYEYVPIIEKFVDDYKGQMIVYNSPRVNFKVTPNHKFPMITRRNGGRYDHYEDIVFEKASSIPMQRRKFILGSKGYNKGTCRYFSDEEIKLCAWIVTEGHFEKRQKRAFGSQINIYQTNKNTKHREEIKELLIKLNIKYIERKDSYVIPSAFATKYRVLLKETKQIPEEFYELPIEQMRLFLETCIKGDGYKQENKVTGYISTADKYLAEQYQRISILAGYNAYINSRKKNYFDKEKTIKFKNTKTTYYVYIRFETCFDLEFKKNRQIEEYYEGKVWCIQTKNENFVMRRNDKVCVSGNSRIMDMLLLQEAKDKKIVLPMKPAEERGTLTEKEEYQGAYRDVFKFGRISPVGVYDIASAYPSMITNFCLDPANICTVPLNSPIKEGDLRIEENVFRQNPDAILPTVVKKIMTIKNNIKDELSKCPLNSEQYKSMKIKYDAIKSVVNSAYGVFGLRFFRLFKKEVASATTFLVRDLLHYVQDKLEKQGYEIIYIDTDSIMINNNSNDISDTLNNYVKQWAKEKYNKVVDVEFEYKGYFDPIILLTKCRYKGWLVTDRGTEVKTKGIEAKRKDSTEFMKRFQNELLDKIKNKENKENIFNWIKEEIKQLPNQQLKDIAFPCKLSKKPKDYRNLPIFVRAMNNTPDFKKKVGNNFYYIFVKPDGEQSIKTLIKVKPTIDISYAPIELDKNLTRKEGIEYARKQFKQPELDSSRISVLHQKSKAKDVMAFDEDNNEHIKRDMVDWDMIIRRNILMKLDTIFEAMGWDVKEIGYQPTPKLPKIKAKPTQIKVKRVKPIERPQEVENERENNNYDEIIL